MIRLHIMLNNRRRFVFSAAMAAVLVLRAGGANAGFPSPVTVRCVTKTSISPNPNCTPSTTYTTISAAIGAPALPGDVIFVGPGTYNESVTISTPTLSLLGAQAGNDARVDRHDPTKESIVDGKGSSAFIVNAPYVVIDGFTVRGGTAGTPPAGIYLGAYYLPEILNNILEKNSTGVYLDGSLGPFIVHNLFRNNYAEAATNSSYGIISSGAGGPRITENEFTGNKTAAIDVTPGPTATRSSSAIITNNTSENDGSFVIFIGSNLCAFSHNRGKNFGAHGAFSDAGDAAVAVGPGNTFLDIGDNDLENGEARISNGIAFTTVFDPPAANSNVIVRNNKIKGFPGNGIVAEVLSGTPSMGTLYGSWIVGNEVRDNGMDGIFIEGAGVNNQNILLLDNEAEGNHVDCQDTSKGLGTLGTRNDWFNNTGNSSSPAGLCTPGRRHDH